MNLLTIDEVEIEFHLNICKAMTQLQLAKKIADREIGRHRTMEYIKTAKRAINVDTYELNGEFEIVE